MTSVVRCRENPTESRSRYYRPGDRCRHNDHSCKNHRYVPTTGTPPQVSLKIHNVCSWLKAGLIASSNIWIFILPISFPTHSSNTVQRNSPNDCDGTEISLTPLADPACRSTSGKNVIYLTPNSLKKSIYCPMDV